MKYLVLIVALMVNLSALNWPSDYDEAIERAKKEKKMVYMFIGSEYCKYCEKLEKDVFSKNEVMKKLKKSYVLLYLSRDIDDIPSKYLTRPVPRHYFITPDEKIVYTTVGYRSVEGFYELLDEVDEAK